MYDAPAAQSPEPLPFRPIGDLNIDRWLALKAGELSVLEPREAIFRLEEMERTGPAAHVSAFQWAILRNRLGDFRIEIENRAKAVAS